MACLSIWNQFLSILAKYVEAGMETAINQLRYMLCLNQFSEELDNQETQLNAVQEEVHRKVEEEENSTNVADEPVEKWMEKTDEEMENVHQLQNEIKEDRRCLNAWSPDWFWRYQKSKEANHLTETLMSLKKERDEFKKLTHESSLPNCGLGQLIKSFMSYKASESALRDIMKGFDTSGVNIIGLHGMPGAGKTTLAIKAREEAKTRKLFDEFAEVTVSEQPNIEKIQAQLAEQLDLKFYKDSTRERAKQLKLRLQDKKKKLVILDDVWGKLELNEIGIPACDYCKILLTTGRLHVCQSMDCQAIVLLDLLTEDEAWTLFKQSASIEDDNCDLIDVARKVSIECHCLPIGIVSVGHALKGKQHLSDWELALRKLQLYEYPEIRDIDEGESAYKCLQLSFDSLEREETKICLLLCSLLQEDHEISAEDLTRYVVGLELFEGLRSINDALLEVLGVINELIDSHLLLETKTEGIVKMHDLVRAAMLWIGRNYSVLRVACCIGLDEWPKDENFTDYAAIALLDTDIRELPDRLDYPRLQMLLLASRRGIRKIEYTKVADTSFQGLEKLKVLSLTREILSIQSVECLTNLQTLELKYCTFTSKGQGNTVNLSSLRNLKKLEILNLFGSDIGELPDEIGELKNLKLLELTECCIERIPSNMIRKLSKLEELYIGSFENWDVEGSSNASLMELNSLQHLAFLSLTYRNKIPEGFAFSSKLIGYHIHICDCQYPRFESRLRYPTSRIICLVSDEDIINACKELFKNAYDLRLQSNNTCFQNMMPGMSQMGFQRLSRFNISCCEMECITGTAKEQKVAKNAFSNLVEMNICSTTLKEICDGSPPEGFLKKLQALTISGCNNMITIFPVELLQRLQKLESMTIENCENLQDIFQLDETLSKECLSHLKMLELRNLNRLMCVWKGPIQCVHLKNLTGLIVCYCENLKSLLSPLLAHDLVHLEKLEVRCCDQLEHVVALAEKDEQGKEIFSKAHPQKVLTNSELKGSNKLEAISEIEDQTDINNMEEIVLPKLLSLCLEDLPSFIKICQRGYHFICPSLAQLRVKRCPKMRMSFIAAPDGSVHIKSEAQTIKQDVTIGSTTSQVIVAPQLADNGSDWICFQGKWIPKEGEDQEE